MCQLKVAVEGRGTWPWKAREVVSPSSGPVARGCGRPSKVREGVSPSRGPAAHPLSASPHSGSLMSNVLSSTCSREPSAFASSLAARSSASSASADSRPAASRARAGGGGCSLASISIGTATIEPRPPAAAAIAASTAESRGVVSFAVTCSRRRCTRASWRVASGRATS